MDGSDAPHDDAWDRRWFLRHAGLAAAAGAGLGAVGLPEAAQAAGLTPVTAYSVKDYGAVGNGTTDDRAAIQAALDAVGTVGGAVFFPPGDYVVSGPLAPKASTLIFGSHTPRYSALANPASQCKVRVRSGFTGTGLIVPTASAKGVTIRNLALVGNGVGTNVHGIRMPDAASAAEQSWALQDVSIGGFSGAGIFGRVWIWTLTNCHIHNNAGWGIDASTNGNQWNDVFVANCYLYFNRNGAVFFGGSGISGLVQFVNCRFERSGGLAINPATPLNPSAPGVRVNSAKRLTFANCSTDANMGNGFEFAAAGAGASSVLSHIYVANCNFGRDGTGNQTSQGDYACVKVRGFSSAGADGANEMKFVNCMVGVGKADDAGGGTIIGPKYGVWFDNTVHFQWIGGFADGQTAPFYAGTGSNYRPTLISLQDGMMTLPLEEPTPVTDGMAYVDGSTGRLMVRVNGQWKGTALT